MYTYRKTGNKVADNFVYKHPSLTPPDVETFCQYDVMPYLMDNDIAADFIAQVAKTMQVAVLTDRIDAVA